MEKFDYIYNEGFEINGEKVLLDFDLMLMDMEENKFIVKYEIESSVLIFDNNHKYPPHNPFSIESSMPYYIDNDTSMPSIDPSYLYNNKPGCPNIYNSKSHYETKVDTVTRVYDTWEECIDNLLCISKISAKDNQRRKYFEIQYKINKDIVKNLVIQDIDVIHHVYKEIKEISEFVNECMAGDEE